MPQNNMMNNLTAGLVSVMLSTTLFFTLWALIFHEIPDKNAQALLIIIGCLTTNVTSMVAFWFGSTYLANRQAAQSVTQSDTSNKLAAALAPALAATPPVAFPMFARPADIDAEAWAAMTLGQQLDAVHKRV